MTVPANVTVRTKRVKEARDDAKKEIAEYKSKKEDEFKKFEAEVRRSGELRRQGACRD